MKKYHSLKWIIGIATALALALSLNVQKADSEIEPQEATVVQEATTTPEVEEKPKPTVPTTNALPTKAQTDAAEKVCGEILGGEHMTTCYHDLLAISYAESRWHNEAIGDGGKSWGPFQLYTKVHTDVTWEQATDYEWAARWTLNRLIRNGYPTRRTHSLQSHNGLTYDSEGNLKLAYAYSVMATSDRLLQQGL